MNETINIYELTLEHETAYETYVQNHPNSMFYHSLTYRDFIQGILPNVRPRYFISINQSENIVGILPLFEMEGKYGTIINSLPFYGANGGVLASDIDVANGLILWFCKLLSIKGVAAGTYITNPLVDEPKVLPINFNYNEYRIGQITTLPKNSHSDSLMAIFHQKTRNMVRKAKKLGIKTSVNNDALGFLAHVHKSNMTAIGVKPKPEAFFKVLPQYCKTNVDYKIYLAHMDERPIAALLLFYHKNIVEYYMPAIVKEYRATQALSGLIFNAMSDAIKDGFNLWNWGGTYPEHKDLYRFKSRWGAKDYPYKYYINIRNTDLYKVSSIEIMNEYPYFFVVPYSALNENKPND